MAWLWLAPAFGAAATLVQEGENTTQEGGKVIQKTGKVFQKMGKATQEGKSNPGGGKATKEEGKQPWRGGKAGDTAVMWRCGATPSHYFSMLTAHFLHHMCLCKKFSMKCYLSQSQLKKSDAPIV